MKKILTTISLGAAFMVSFSQGPNYPQNRGQQQYPSYPQQNNNYNQYSSLVINGTQQRQLSVMVDNYQYQANGNNGDVNVGQLNAGNHTVVIYEWKRNFWGKNVQQVVYNSNLYLKPGFETTVYIDVFGRVNISERQLYNNGSYNQGGYGNNGNGVGYGRSKNKHKKQQCGNDGNRRYRDDD